MKRLGVKRYKGSAQDICSAIVKDCWNGRFFQTSTGHFCQFYTRDFGWCTEPLMKLGYAKEVQKTLGYALGSFASNGRITTAISPDGRPFDFPGLSPDSLAYLIRSLRISHSHELIKQYKAFLNKEIERYHKAVFDNNLGLVRKKNFSSIKDYAKRYSSTYDNVMMAMLSEELKKIGILDNPLKSINLKKNIRNDLWQGSYFCDDMKKKPFVTGDANVFPFWSGVFTEKNMLKSAIAGIQEAGLDFPFPLKYSQNALKANNMILQEIFVKGYEQDAIWAHMGPIYISLIKRIDKNKFWGHIEQYRRIIKKHGNYLEVFTCSGEPYKSPFYYADEGMLWASMFLELIKKE